MAFGWVANIRALYTNWVWAGINENCGMTMNQTIIETKE
jgi:hypothetical protein